MRNARKPQREWGYLAPAPSVTPAMRNALLASVISAIGSAVVVASLIEHSGSHEDNTSIAAHAVFTSGPVIATAPALANQIAAPIEARTTANGGLRGAAVSRTTGTIAHPRNATGMASPPDAPLPSAAALAEIPATEGTATAPKDVAPAAAPAQNGLIGKQHPAAKRWRHRHHLRRYSRFGSRRDIGDW
jgi:hypothetical protein